MMRPLVAILALLSAAGLVAAQTTQAEVLKAVTIQVCPDLASTACNEISGGKISGFDTFECAANTDPLIIDCPAGTTFSGDVKVEEDLTVGNDISVGGNLTVAQKVFANELDVDVLEANEVVTKTLDVTGTLTATGDVTLGDTDMMNLSVQGDLTVDGKTTLGDLDVKGEAQFQELKVNGDTDVTGDLRVTGTAQFDENVEVALDVVVGGDLAVAGKTTTDTLEVKGSADIDGDLSVVGSIVSKDGNFDALTTDKLTFDSATGDSLQVEDLTAEKMTVTGSASIEALVATTGQFDELTASKLVVEGTSSLFYVEINDDLVQSDATNTALLQQTTVAGTLNVQGDATFRQSVTIDVDLHVQQHTTIDMNLVVGQDTTLEGTLNVGGDADFDSNVSIDGTLLVVKDATLGPTTVDGSLTVQGTSALLGDVVVGTSAASADMTVTGNLVAEGLAHFAQNLDVDGTLAVAQTITATDVTLTGSLDVGNDVTVQIDLNVQQDVDVGGAVTVAERVVVQSTTATSLLPRLSSTEATITEATIADATITNLNVTNSANINGDIDLTGDIDIGGNSLTVSATVEILNDVIFNDLTASNIQATSATINEVVANEGTFNILRGGDMTADVLTVTDLATLTDIEFTSNAAKILVPNTLEIFGHVTTTDFTADAGIFETTLLANEATLGTLQAKGAASFDAGLTVTGTFSGDTIVAADVTVSNTLLVQGTSTFEDDVQMDAALQVNGDATFSGTVTAQNLTVTNAATLDDLVVNGDFEANIALGKSFIVNAMSPPATTCELLSITNTEVVIGADQSCASSGSNLLQGDNVVITGYAKISDLESPPTGTDYALEVNDGTTTVTGRLEVNQADNEEVFRITSAQRELADRPLMSVGQDEFTIDVAQFEVISIDPSGTLTGDFVNMQRFAQSELRSSFTMTHDNTIALSAEQVTVIGPLAVGGQDRSLTVQDANGLPPPFFVVCKEGTWEECNSKPESVYFEVDRDGGIRIQPQLHLTSILKYLHRIGESGSEYGFADFRSGTVSIPKPGALTSRKGNYYTYSDQDGPTPAELYAVVGGRRDVVLRPAFNNVNNAGGAYYYLSGSDTILATNVYHLQHLRLWLEPNRFAGADFEGYSPAQKQQVNQENVGKVITIFGYEPAAPPGDSNLRGNQMLVSLFVDHMGAGNAGNVARAGGAGGEVGAVGASFPANGCSSDRNDFHPRFFDGNSVFMVETQDQNAGGVISQTCGQEIFIDSEFSASYASALISQTNYQHEDFWAYPRFGVEGATASTACGSAGSDLVDQPPLGLATRQDMFSVTLIMFAEHVSTSGSAADAFSALGNDVLSFAVIGMSAVDISVPTDVECRA